MKTRPLIAILAAALSLQAQAVVQILPAGEFAARDGRPGTGKAWRLNDAQGRALAAQLTAIAAKSAFVIDYEHQSLRSAANGQPAPAAGWATAFEWREGLGLFATDVRWTEAAKARIEADEYRYISPVIQFDERTGTVLGVINAALVNTPALLGMAPVSQAAEAALAALSAQAAQSQTQEDPSMNLLQLLIAALGLKAEATETEALSAIAALKNRAEAQPAIPQALAAALEIKADAPVDTAVASIAALKTRAAGGEQSTVATIAALQAQVAQLTASRHGEQVEQLVSQALKDGKLVPATAEWARNLGRTDLAALQTFLAAAPALPVATPQSGGQAPAGQQAAALSAEEQQVCTLLGLSADDYRKQRAAA
ncbi:MAG: phage protease [Burkholderiales bacterium]|nr:phage protease [Burkholderiales bacterium]